ncbi:MAG: cytochrome c-type biogenesis protein CcmH [Dehalococcoidia bacterium]|nr:cytochrome c-type biogenesis protein CcmH [Dehalococcoidia bacterium]
MGCLNQDMQDVGMYRIEQDVKRYVRWGVLPLALITAMALAHGCATTTAPGVPEAERRASELNKSLMCPVCPGESIDQSQNPLAVQMRAIVDEKLALGWSEREIKDFFVERYGPSVLMEPPSAGFGIAAWIVPPLAFALAIASLYLTLRWMRRISEQDQDNENEIEDSERMEYVRRLEAATGSDAGSDGESEREGSR